MNKSGKNGKRMSLDPAKQQHSLISQRIYNPPPTQLDVRRQQAQDSQISITHSGHDQFPIHEYTRIFATIARGSDRLDSSTLYSLLKEEGYGQNLYLAVEMIALLDRERKGYITEQQFISFFTDRRAEPLEQPPSLTPQLQQQQKWAKAIQQNIQTLQCYQSAQYCRFVAEHLKAQSNSSQ